MSELTDVGDAVIRRTQDGDAYPEDALILLDALKQALEREQKAWAAAHTTAEDLDAANQRERQLREALEELREWGPDAHYHLEEIIERVLGRPQDALEPTKAKCAFHGCENLTPCPDHEMRKP